MLAQSFENAVKKTSRRLAIQRQIQAMGRQTPSRSLRNLRVLRRAIFATRYIELSPAERRMQNPACL